MKLLFCVLTLFSFSIAKSQTWVEKTKDNLPKLAQLPNNSMDAHIADLDADGDLDIVVAVEYGPNFILINDGYGTFRDASLTAIPRDSEDIAIADLNNDTRLDIVFVSEDDQENELYFGNIGKVFQDDSSKLPVKGISNAIVCGDFDGDGWVDLIIGNKGQNNYLKNENGTLLDKTTEYLPLHNDITQDLELGDFDNDGDLDLLVGNEDRNLLYENQNGKFKDVTSIVFEGGINEETREADFVDIDNDGDLDIYFANVRMFTAKPPIQRLLVQEGGKFIDVSINQLQLSPSVGVVDGDFFDIDQDGDSDLILGKLDGLSIALNDGQGNFVEVTNFRNLPTTLNPIVDVEIADFNGDTIPDIYLACFQGSDRLFLSELP